MPAFVNKRFGESGIRLDDGTMVCDFDLKKSRNDWRIWVLVIMAKLDDKDSRKERMKASWNLAGKVIGFDINQRAEPVEPPPPDRDEGRNSPGKSLARTRPRVKHSSFHLKTVIRR